MTCRPAPARAAALASVIRAIERVSVETIADQARAIGRAGSMPRGFVTPLEPLPPLDDLLAPDDENWQRAILQEEFASAMECRARRVGTSKRDAIALSAPFRRSARRTSCPSFRLAGSVEDFYSDAF